MNTSLWEKPQGRQLGRYLRLSLPVLEQFLWDSSAQRKRPLLSPQKVTAATIAVHICGDAKMRRLNHQFRYKDKTTDVLSFPLLHNLRKGLAADEWATIQWEPEGQKRIYIGDIVISKDQAQRQARQFAITWEEEVLQLFIHGFLHLCGYDHELSVQEEKLMSRQEELLFAQTAAQLKKKKTKKLKNKQININ